MNALNGEDSGNALRKSVGGMPWGSNPKATAKYRRHVMDMRMEGKEPLNPGSWWNANRTKIAGK